MHAGSTSWDFRERRSESATRAPRNAVDQPARICLAGAFAKRLSLCSTCGNWLHSKSMRHPIVDTVQTEEAGPPTRRKVAAEATLDRACSHNFSTSQQIGIRRASAGARFDGTPARNASESRRKTHRGSRVAPICIPASDSTLEYTRSNAGVKRAQRTPQ